MYTDVGKLRSVTSISLVFHAYIDTAEFNINFLQRFLEKISTENKNKNYLDLLKIEKVSDVSTFF